jgi:hypothetical protein
VWAGQISGPATEQLRGLATDRSGDIYLTGIFGGTTSAGSFTADFDPTPGTFLLSSAGGNDAFYCKLNSGGNFLWAHSIGGLGMDSGWGIHVSNTFELYITGYFMFTNDFNPFTPVSYLSSAGSTDCFVLKISQQSTLVPTVANSSEICSGESAILTATAAGMVIWYDTNTFNAAGVATGATFMTPPLFANTTYFASSGQDCGGNNIYVPVNILVEECTATIETEVLNAALRVFPNPSGDDIYIRCASRQHIVIYDQLGTMINDFISGENDSVVRVRHLAPGVYFIKTDHLTKAVKLVVYN